MERSKEQTLLYVHHYRYSLDMRPVEPALYYQEYFELPGLGLATTTSYCEYFNIGVGSR